MIRRSRGRRDDRRNGRVAVGSRLPSLAPAYFQRRAARKGCRSAQSRNRVPPATGMRYCRKMRVRHDERLQRGKARGMPRREVRHGFSNAVSLRREPMRAHTDNRRPAVSGTPQGKRPIPPRYRQRTAEWFCRPAAGREREGTNREKS